MEPSALVTTKYKTLHSSGLVVEELHVISDGKCLVYDVVYVYDNNRD